MLYPTIKVDAMGPVSLTWWEAQVRCQGRKDTYPFDRRSLLRASQYRHAETDDRNKAECFGLILG